MSGDYQLEDTVYLPFSTRAFSTGIPTALVSGEVQIYEDASVTQITGAETLSVSLDGVAGFNMVQVDMTAANGFEAGKSYTLILAAGTVDSVSCVGEVVGHFTIEKSAAAKDLANGTDGLGAIKTETATIAGDVVNLDGAAMRGTDSAALASVCTEARLSELDAGTGGKAANQIDVIQTDTTTDIPALIAALNNISVADVLTTQMTESYNADGAAPTLAQALHLIIAYLMERSVSSTTVTAKKLDGSTTAATFTLNDATAPTSVTRST